MSASHPESPPSPPQKLPELSSSLLPPQSNIVQLITESEPTLEEQMSIAFDLKLSEALNNQQRAEVGNLQVKGGALRTIAKNIAEGDTESTQQGLLDIADSLAGSCTVLDSIVDVRDRLDSELDRLLTRITTTINSKNTLTGQKLAEDLKEFTPFLIDYSNLSATTSQDIAARPALIDDLDNIIGFVQTFLVRYAAVTGNTVALCCRCWSFVTQTYSTPQFRLEDSTLLTLPVSLLLHQFRKMKSTDPANSKFFFSNLADFATRSYPEKLLKQASDNMLHSHFQERRLRAPGITMPRAGSKVHNCTRIVVTAPRTELEISMDERAKRNRSSTSSTCRLCTYLVILPGEPPRVLKQKSKHILQNTEQDGNSLIFQEKQRLEPAQSRPDSKNFEVFIPPRPQIENNPSEPASFPFPPQEFGRLASYLGPAQGHSAINGDADDTEVKHMDSRITEPKSPKNLHQDGKMINLESDLVAPASIGPAAPPVPEPPKARTKTRRGQSEANPPEYLGKRTPVKRAKNFPSEPKEPRVSESIKSKISKTKHFFQFPGCKKITIGMIRRMSERLVTIKEAVQQTPVIPDPKVLPPSQEEVIYTQPEESNASSRFYIRIHLGADLPDIILPRSAVVSISQGELIN